jgi:hypothetical protein
MAGFERGGLGDRVSDHPGQADHHGTGAGLAGGRAHPGDDLVQVLMDHLEAAPGHIPMRLLSREGKVDQIDQR